jgi:hypothetical protein
MPACVQKSDSRSMHEGFRSIRVRFEDLRDFLHGTIAHVVQDQRSALARRKPLQRDDDREPDILAKNECPIGRRRGELADGPIGAVQRIDELGEASLDLLVP